MAMVQNNFIFFGIIILLIMLLLIILFFLAYFKPWRFLLRSSFRSPLALKADDIERPLLNEDSDLLPSHRNKPGDTIVLDIDESRDILVGETLRRPISTAHIAEEQKYTAKEDVNYDPRHKRAKTIKRISSNFPDQGSGLSLEVVTGPASGLYYSVMSTDASKLPLTLGRVPPSGLLLKDSEISGKHARINWNPNKWKWELVDMGSLNGTLLNSKAINHPDSGSRTWGEPKELADGDVITLGTTSQINVQITSSTESDIPVWIGIAVDPMSMRRGGKKLPMEDVCYYQWPLPGADQFGVFGICDGHGGALAAKDASKILPETIATALSDSLKREKVLSQNDASDVLRDAFFQTEARLNYYYEGCTATVLLVWVDRDEGLFAQCANVGDSACVLNFDGKQLKMSEDHRITSFSERQRINEVGQPLKDGDTRLCGLNLGRMLGDKYLKEQDGRFSSKPYVSQVVRIAQASEAFALLASDGLWDVISVKKAIQLILQAREKYSTDTESSEKIADYLLNEARSLRTKDNTSIVYVDFDIAFRTLCKYDS
ncbi:hypothetical protein RND81_12G070500 [Saponaria officinalis]|uniref:protein-serine/threonine phosphatase n=1 Tax=Saponaria officinalis TaxID=3572 RepID=A0AAW1H7J4_SAPOF